VAAIVALAMALTAVGYGPHRRLRHAGRGCDLALVVDPRRLATLDATADVAATAEASTKVRTAS
jgi:hypothetical protein